MTIKIMKSELYATPLFLGSGSVICPICGVGSNIYPCYCDGEDTAVVHRLTYCGHRLSGNLFVLALPGIPEELR